MSSKRRAQCSHDGCGSRRINTGDDGYRYCDQGHQQSELGTIVAEDTGELLMHGQASRKKDLDASSFTSRGESHLSRRVAQNGTDTRQVVMRKQLRWLIDIQQLPAELETVVRDLWALRLQKLQGRATYDSATDTEAPRSEMFSSQSEGESSTDAATLNSERSRQASRKRPSGPSLLDLLCVECIGAMLLRIPLTVADLHKWVSDGDLLYYKAAKELPLSMRIHLPGHLQEQLEPQSIVSPDTIHRNTMDILSSLQVDFGMTAPALNHPLILYRWVQELALPLEIFVAAQRLGTLLELDYCHSLGARVGTNQNLRYPEIRLMALIVISTKLLFPFDDLRRYPKSPGDLAVLQLDWSSWAGLQQCTASPLSGQAVGRHLTFEEAFSMTEAGSLELADDSLDQYLDWCENNIASEEVRDRGKAGRDAEFRRMMFEWFPSSSHPGPPRARHEIPSSTGLTSDSKLVRVQQGLRSGRVVPDDGSDDIPRIGMDHTQYRSDDELKGTCKAFYHKASRLAGCSLHGMVRAVFLMERQMLKHEKLLNVSKRGEHA